MTKSMPLDTTSIPGEQGDKTKCPRYVWPELLINAFVINIPIGTKGQKVKNGPSLSYGLFIFVLFNPFTD